MHTYIGENVFSSYLTKLKSDSMGLRARVERVKSCCVVWMWKTLLLDQIAQYPKLAAALTAEATAALVLKAAAVQSALAGRLLTVPYPSPATGC